MGKCFIMKYLADVLSPDPPIPIPRRSPSLRFVLMESTRHPWKYFANWSLILNKIKIVTYQVVWVGAFPNNERSIYVGMIAEEQTLCALSTHGTKIPTKTDNQLLLKIVYSSTLIFTFSRLGINSALQSNEASVNQPHFPSGRVLHVPLMALKLVYMCLLVITKIS